MPFITSAPFNLAAQRDMALSFRVAISFYHAPPSRSVRQFCLLYVNGNGSPFKSSNALSRLYIPY